MSLSRREWLKLACGTAVLSSGLGRALAASEIASTEFFIFIHAAGGWDVTLWADPRNERRGLVDPASTDNTDVAGIRRWVDAPLDGGARSFQIVQPSGCNIPFGPGIGDLVELCDRVCVVNGLAMNTVSHPDGTSYSTTGRHLQGGRAAQSSVNTALAHEFGLGQVLPSVSVQFPSAFVGDALDRRAVPLTVDRVGSIGRTLARTDAYESADDRQLVTTLLSEEATELASRAAYPHVLAGLGLQYGTLRRMLGPEMQDTFSEGKLKAAHPDLGYKSRFVANGALNAAFSIEALKHNLVRCVAFAIGGFDTHVANYKTQAALQQDAFDLVAKLVRTLDATPHPTLPKDKLSEHTHILVVSDFCRTPQINIGGGRDHYPNNSALVISPRFRCNLVFGRSDPEQLLPLAAKRFLDGNRPIAPPDLLATFLAAFRVDPRKHMRDGEVVPELLRA